MTLPSALVRPYHSAMQSLLERLEWVETARGLSALRWATRAGLSGRYLSTLKGRLRARGDAAGADHECMVALARAAGVSVAWLEDGTGSPEDGAPAAEGAATHGDGAEAPAPTDDESAPEAALVQVLDPRRHTLADLDAARAALRAIDRNVRADAAPEDLARAWLEAAAALRRRGVVATPRAVTEQVAVGSLPRRTAPSVANEAGDAAARELGVEPGEAAAALRGLLKRK